VTCTDGSAVSIALDDGDNFSSGRRMRLGVTTDFLSYELYQEAGLENVFGSGAQAVAHNGTGAAETVTVHGNLPGGQNVPVGSYSDIIDVTITL
jgi:spore coat protein U-like protein